MRVNPDGRSFHQRVCLILPELDVLDSSIQNAANGTGGVRMECELSCQCRYPGRAGLSMEVKDRLGRVLGMLCLVDEHDSEEDIGIKAKYRYSAS